MKFLYLLVICICGGATAQFVNNPEPTRPIDLWNPFGTTPPPRPENSPPHRDEVIVKLSIGNLIGKKILIENLPWTPTQDKTEEIPRDRMYPEPNPLPRKNNVTIYEFLGVPYAEPPVSQRRFKSPQQLINLPGKSPFLALTHPAACPQDVETQPQPEVDRMFPWTVNEDCLYLNIFTPDVSKSSGQVFPVLVFLHGGNFQTGNINDWPGHVLASRGMVVVNVAYRLGAFGFMSMGDKGGGNYGLQDQRLALTWVRDHIANFGGDPQAVTLAGHDAGAVSVGLHMLSPFSKGLFRNGIALSGADVSYHSTIGKPALAFNNTMKLGHYIGCVDKLPQNVWDCIQTRSTNDIIRASTEIPIEYNRYLFLPSVDGINVPALPFWTLLNVPNGQANIPSPVPLLMGMNMQDGSEVILEHRRLGEFNKWNNVDWQMMREFALEYSFRHNYTMNKEAIAQAILDRYTWWPDPSDEWMIRQSFIDLATDCYYTSPISLSAHLHSASGSRTWLFVNQYNFSLGYDDLRFVPGWMGVCRECDLYLLFGYAFAPSTLRHPQLKNVTFVEEDKNATIIFTNFVRRFVIDQDPNYLFDGTWSMHEPRRHWYLEFNYTRGDELRVPGVLKRDYRFREVAFWNEYIPSLVNYMTTTFPPEEMSWRRENVVIKWILGVTVLILMIVIVIAISLGYMYCEKTAPLIVNEDQALVDYTENFPSQASLPQHYGRVSAM